MIANARVSLSTLSTVSAEEDLRVNLDLVGLMRWE
jgi:hypothetical protein